MPPPVRGDHRQQLQQGAPGGRQGGTRGAPGGHRRPPPVEHQQGPPPGPQPLTTPPPGARQGRPRSGAVGACSRQGGSTRSERIEPGSPWPHLPPAPEANGSPATARRPPGMQHRYQWGHPQGLWRGHLDFAYFGHRQVRKESGTRSQNETQLRTVETTGGLAFVQPADRWTAAHL